MHMVFDTHGLEGRDSRWLIGLGCVALCVGARTIPCLHVELLTLKRTGVPMAIHTHTHHSTYAYTQPGAWTVGLCMHTRRGFRGDETRQGAEDAVFCGSCARTLCPWCPCTTRLLLPPSQVRARRDEAPYSTDARPSSSALRLSKPLTHSPLPLPIPSSQTQTTRNHAGSRHFSPGSPLCGGPCHGRSALYRQPL